MALVSAAVLGRFLEYSVATPDIQASFNFYGKLGFAQATVGEAWPHRYAVMTDGRLCIGLHEAVDFSPSLTFVRPNLLQHLGALERAGVQFTCRTLGNDVFNEVGWSDPTGNALRLVEARTFSPLPLTALPTTACGYFLELALPSADLEVDKSYWESLGFVGMDERDGSLPHIACTSDTIDVGLYPAATVKMALLRFDSEDLRRTLSDLAALGVEPDARRSMPFRSLPGAVVVSPEGTSLLISQAEAG